LYISRWRRLFPFVYLSISPCINQYKKMSNSSRSFVCFRNGDHLSKILTFGTETEINLVSITSSMSLNMQILHWWW
jgi:hypothetical protein